MPQLDILAYSSEVIWLVVIFFGLYFLVLRLGLPKLYKVLRYRQDKLFLISNSVEQFEKELFLINKSIKELLIQSVGYLRVLSDHFIRLTELSVEEGLTSGRGNVVNYRELSKKGRVNLVKGLLKSELKEKNNFVKKELLAKVIN